VHVLDGRVTGTLERFSTIVAGAVAALAGLCGSSGGGGISGGPHVHLASELVPRAFLSLAVVLRRLARDTSAGAGHGGGAGAGGGGAAGGSGDTGEMQRLALVLNAAHLALAELMPRMAAGVSRLLGRSGISSGGSGGGSSRGGDSGGAAPLFRRARAVFLALISQTSRVERAPIRHASMTRAPHGATNTQCAGVDASGWTTPRHIRLQTHGSSNVDRWINTMRRGAAVRSH
jgi:hypothetical protein